jgi:hypothetical protein
MRERLLDRMHALDKKQALLVSLFAVALERLKPLERGVPHGHELNVRHVSLLQPKTR